MADISSPPRNDSLNTRWPTMIDGKKKTKKRVRNFTPADRAAHRVFEKSRREAFNDRLLELARLIPETSSARRLSKHTIVNESISYHKTQNRRCLSAVHGIRALLAERDHLLAEVNSLRAFLKPGTFEIRVARLVKGDVLGLLQLEHEFVNHSGHAIDSEDSSDDLDPAQPDIEDSGENVAGTTFSIPQRTELTADHSLISDHVDSIQGDFELWDNLAIIQPLNSNSDREYHSHTVTTAGQQIPPSLVSHQPTSLDPLPGAGAASDFSVLNDTVNRQPLYLQYDSLLKDLDPPLHSDPVNDPALLGNLPFTNYLVTNSSIPVNDTYPRNIETENTLPLY